MSDITFGDVIKTVRVSVVAEVCGLTPKAVYKWLEKGGLPRTEFTDETDYAKKNLSCIWRQILNRTD